MASLGPNPPPAPKFCPNCGAALTPGANNCTQCGASVFGSAQPAWSPPPPQPRYRESGLDDLASAVDNSGMVGLAETYIKYKIAAAVIGGVLFIIVAIVMISMMSSVNTNPDVNDPGGSGFSNPPTYSLSCSDDDSPRPFQPAPRWEAGTLHGVSRRPGIERWTGTAGK